MILKIDDLIAAKGMEKEAKEKKPSKGPSERIWQKGANSRRGCRHWKKLSAHKTAHKLKKAPQRLK
jgi:hypothetical protein